MCIWHVFLFAGLFFSCCLLLLKYKVSLMKLNYCVFYKGLYLGQGLSQWRRLLKLPSDQADQAHKDFPCNFSNAVVLFFCFSLDLFGWFLVLQYGTEHRASHGLATCHPTEQNAQPFTPN